MILVKDDIGRLPIYYACKHGNATVEVIQLLLESDADKKSIFEKDGYGELPIKYACEEDGGTCTRGCSIVAGSQYLEYKRERRIKSGADIIICGVLPFLPVEDDSDSESSSSNDGADHFDDDYYYCDDSNDVKNYGIYY